MCFTLCKSGEKECTQLSLDGKDKDKGHPSAYLSLFTSTTQRGMQRGWLAFGVDHAARYGGC